MGIVTLSSTGRLVPGLLRVMAPSTAQPSPVSASKRHLAAAAEPAQRPQLRPLSASGASSLAERESTAAEQLPTDEPDLGLPRDFGLKYELMQPIGRGAFKTTHLASERGTDGRVAVGVLPKERAGATLEHNLQMIAQEVSAKQQRKAAEMPRLDTIPPYALHLRRMPCL